MSAIAGLFHFYDDNVSIRDLERVANALRAHGPDRAGTTSIPGIGLVNVLMTMTPEDRFDRQPFRGPSGSIITADIRLDNRDEILEQLGVTPEQAAAWPNSRLVLSAWEKHGDDIWPTLRGPFAVAIWDSRRRILDARSGSSRTSMFSLIIEVTPFLRLQPYPRAFLPSQTFRVSSTKKSLQIS